MSNFDYENLTLTYLIPHSAGIPYLTEMERVSLCNLFTHESDVRFVAKTTGYVKLCDEKAVIPHHLEFVGFYCVFVFETSEDLMHFKLTYPTGEVIANNMKDLL